MTMSNGLSSDTLAEYGLSMAMGNNIQARRSIEQDVHSSTAIDRHGKVYPNNVQIKERSLPKRGDSLLGHRPSRQQVTPAPGETNAESTRSKTYSSQIPEMLQNRPSDTPRIRALNREDRSLSSDSRHGKNTRLVENFSRPRAPSIKLDTSNSSLQGSTTFPLHTHNENRNLPRRSSNRDRGFSTSSSQPASHSLNTALRPSMSIPDYHSPELLYARHPNLHASNYKPTLSQVHPDGNYSAHRREQLSRQTGYESDGVRASIRSAQTTNSSFFGTSGTERTSVMTKSSSATSIYGKDDGLSVDDAIGMYEGGFGDSPSDDLGESIPHKSQRDDIDESLALPLPGPLIRDSRAIFSKGGLDTTSVKGEHISHDGESDTHDTYLRPMPLSSHPITPTSGMQPGLNRDRYGFKKASQHVALEQYEAWNEPYVEYLGRRRKKWVALMKDNGLAYDNPQIFPPKSAKMKRFVRKGIPPEWRGAAWFFYAGGPAVLANHKGLYEELVRKASAGGVNEADEEIIERDLHRTFPDNVKFKPDLAEGGARDSHLPLPETPVLQSLRRVLQTFAVYNPKIGYCQSLNFLAGLLLLFMEEEKAFWMLNIITRVYLPGTHELSLEGANVDLGVLMSAIRDMMPNIWAKIGGELDGTNNQPHGKMSMRLPPISLCTTAWFMSCFIGTLPIEVVLRVWDSFFYEGSKTLFRIALAIFKVGEKEIMAVTDPMEIFQVVQTIPRRLLDASALMEACFKRRNGFGHISQSTIEKGRVERRAGYARERAEASGVGEAVTIGRKGTIFGRKKFRLSKEI